MHGYHERRATDIPVDARRVLVVVRIRHLVCPTRGCPQTFREQLPGGLEHYRRRTARLVSQIGAVVHEPAGRAGTRVLSAPAGCLSRHTALRILPRLPLPQPGVPRVPGVDDFALRRRHRYATVLIDAETRERIDDGTSTLFAAFRSVYEAADGSKVPPPRELGTSGGPPARREGKVLICADTVVCGWWIELYRHPESGKGAAPSQ